MTNNSELPGYEAATSGNWQDDEKQNQSYPPEKEPEPPSYHSEKQGQSYPQEKKDSKHDGGLIFPPALVQLLSEPTLVLERQIERLNIFLGFDQLNKYKIFNSHGIQIGWMKEKTSFGKLVRRQLTGTSRPFKVDIFTMDMVLLLEIKRSYTVINSNVIVRLPVQEKRNATLFEEVGRSDQVFHAFKRKYNLSEKKGLRFKEFGSINARPLAQCFPVKNAKEQVIAGVDRSWTGLLRELFMQSPMYVVRFDIGSFAEIPQKHYSPPGPALNLAQRAVMLGCAISIDLDYFTDK